MPEARAMCLGSAASNLICSGVNVSHIGLHRDVKDAPLTAIAWVNAHQGPNEARTRVDGGEFVVPGLQLMFHPAATGSVTVVVMSTAVLTHGTLSQTVTGNGQRIGAAHFMRCEDVMLGAAIRLGAMRQFGYDHSADAMQRLGFMPKEERKALRKQLLSQADASVLGQIFTEPMLKFRKARRASYSGDVTAHFLPWFPFFSTSLENNGYVVS